MKLKQLFPSAEEQITNGERAGRNEEGCGGLDALKMTIDTRFCEVSLDT